MSLVPYPPEDDETDDPKGITVRFPKDEYEDYRFIARLWNELDKLRGIKRRHKWKPSSVLRQAARQLRDSIKDKLEEWPETPSEQDDFLKRQISDAKEELKRQKK